MYFKEVVLVTFLFLLTICSCTKRDEWGKNVNATVAFGCEPRLLAFKTKDLFKNDSRAARYNPSITVLHRCGVGYCSRKGIANKEQNVNITLTYFMNGKFVLRNVTTYTSCNCCGGTSH